MILRSRSLCIVVVASLLGAGAAFAQSAPPASSKSAAESSRERRKALEEDAAQKQQRLDEANKRTLDAVQARNQKRADCRKQAKAQKVKLMKRAGFVRKCAGG